MPKTRRQHVTELNDYDKKILNKYTRFYTNFIESNTAKTDMLKNKRFKRKDGLDS